jgi:hypothetical protein
VLERLRAQRPDPRRSRRRHQRRPHRSSAPAPLPAGRRRLLGQAYSVSDLIAVVERLITPAAR